MSITKKLKNAGAWQLFQVSIQVIMQFAFVAVMARLLSKDDFGLMAIATAFIGLGMIFSTGGMGSALIQRKDIASKHINSAFQASVVMGLLVSIAFFVFSNVIAEYYEEPRLETIIKVVGFSVLFNSINSVSRSLLQKELKFKTTANITVAITALGYALGIILAINNLGVWSLVIQSVSTSFATLLVMLYFSPIKISFSFDQKEFKELFHYGFGITLLGLNNYLANSGLSLILGKIFTPTILGIFERVYLLKTLPSQHIGNILDTSMFPILSDIKDDNEKMFRIYQHSLGITNTILMPLALYLIFFSKEIVLILLGENWLDATIPLQIMLVVLPFHASGRMADSVARAKGFVYQNAFRKFIFTIILMSSVAFSATHYGLIGAATAVTLSYIFNYFTMLLFIRGIFNKGLLYIFGKPLIAALNISIIVLILISASVTILSGWGVNSILMFIITSLFLAGCIFIIAWKRPNYLGFYFQEVLIRFGKGH